MADFKINGVTFASESGGVVSLSNANVFPAGNIINYKFIEIGSYELTGNYATLNITSAATTTQGYQVISTSFTPKSSNSKIFCQAQLFVSEATNIQDYAIAALFVDTTNISQQLNTARQPANSNLDYLVATLSGEFVNSSTTAKTIQIRASGNNNNPIDVNLYSRADANQSDGYIRTGLSIFEVKQ